MVETQKIVSGITVPVNYKGDKDIQKAKIQDERKQIQKCAKYGTQFGHAC